MLSSLFKLITLPVWLPLKIAKTLLMLTLLAASFATAAVLDATILPGLMPIALITTVALGTLMIGKAIYQCIFKGKTEKPYSHPELYPHSEQPGTTPNTRSVGLYPQLPSSISSDPCPLHSRFEQAFEQIPREIQEQLKKDSAYGLLQERTLYDTLDADTLQEIINFVDHIEQEAEKKSWLQEQSEQAHTPSTGLYPTFN